MQPALLPMIHLYLFPSMTGKSSRCSAGKVAMVLQHSGRFSKVLQHGGRLAMILQHGGRRAMILQHGGRFALVKVLQKNQVNSNQYM